MEDFKVYKVLENMITIRNYYFLTVTLALNDE